MNAYKKNTHFNEKKERRKNERKHDKTHLSLLSHRLLIVIDFFIVFFFLVAFVALVSKNISRRHSYFGATIEQITVHLFDTLYEPMNEKAIRIVQNENIET